MRRTNVQQADRLGALPSAAGLQFRVWAPKRRTVDAIVESDDGSALQSVPLVRDAHGYFTGLAPGAGAGTLYRYRLDGAADAYPDPASRFQPHGPHGPSMAIDPAAYHWRSDSWLGVGGGPQVVYELHVGTFTREGSWAAAAERLTHLADLGVTVIELMPVADFAGAFGWGYDGVNLFAPTRLYGTPDEMRAFIDAAHGLGLAVILDVVYNHFGPDGNYLRRFADAYFATRYKTDWGEAINFDDTDSGPVRDYFLHNVAYWIEEFRLDGLRIDATQDLHDAGPEHILSAITRVVEEAARGRRTLVVGENEPQLVRLLEPRSTGGYGLDMLWNDDFHHSAMVCLTGRHEAYYSDHRGAPQEFVSAAKYGYLFQGQFYSWQKQRRGSPTRGLAPSRLVVFTQNHDQVANSGRGQRCHELAGGGRNRAMAALLLLQPGTPMLFMGQEFAASSSFFYFADHKPEIAAQVAAGRAEFLAQFPSLAAPEMQAMLPDPCDVSTFERSKLDWQDRVRNDELWRLHRDLIQLRKTDPVLSRDVPGMIDGAVLGPEAFLLRWFSPDQEDRLLLVNFGNDLDREAAPEPLLAHPARSDWSLLWSSEDPRYGGTGTPPWESEQGWHLPGRAAILLQATRET